MVALMLLSTTRVLPGMHYLKVGGAVEKRMSFNDWQQVVDVNLTGTFLCGRAAVLDGEGRQRWLHHQYFVISRHGNRPG